jgi:hypothetical protein
MLNIHAILMQGNNTFESYYFVKKRVYLQEPSKFFMAGGNWFNFFFGGGTSNLVGKTEKPSQVVRVSRCRFAIKSIANAGA